MKGGWYWGTIAIASCLIWGGLPTPGQAQPRPASDCPGQPIAANTRQQGNVIVVGRQSNLPYVVVVPGQTNNLLNQVRICAPDAFLSRSRQGNYVHAGAFAHRAKAESLTWLLRSQGLDARVVYFR